MRIAVNTRFPSRQYSTGTEQYAGEIFTRLVAEHPKHTFIFIFNKAIPAHFVTTENAIPVTIHSPVRQLLLFRRWYDFQLRLLLKKHKADLLVNADRYCNLSTTVPQVMMICDLAFFHFPKSFPRAELHYFKRFMSRFIYKAASVVTISEAVKQEIINHYHTDPKKISVTGMGVSNIFKPLTLEEKEQVKEKYSGGKEYFLCTGPIHPHYNLITLLKAFSLFKKRQQSNMQLLLVGKMDEYGKDFEEKFSSFKYRNEVHILDINSEDLARVMGAAYALIYTSLYEGFPLPLLQAMHSDTPVISSNAGSIPGIAGDAALYADSHKPEDIAGQMMLIYKDEIRRSQLIVNGRIQRENFSWEKATQTIWSCIENAVIPH